MVHPPDGAPTASEQQLQVLLAMLDESALAQTRDEAINQVLPALAAVTGARAARAWLNAPAGPLVLAGCWSQQGDELPALLPTADSAPTLRIVASGTASRWVTSLRELPPHPDADNLGLEAALLVPVPSGVGLLELDFADDPPPGAQLLAVIEAAARLLGRAEPPAHPRPHLQLAPPPDPGE